MVQLSPGRWFLTSTTILSPSQTYWIQILQQLKATEIEKVFPPFEKSQDLNGRAGQLSIDSDDAAFYAVGRDAVMPIAVFHFVRAVKAGFGHCEIVLHVEIVDAAARRSAVAFPLARMSWFCKLRNTQNKQV